jgi:putative ABC transport system permease protein
MRKLDPDGALFGVMTADDALANWSWRYRLFGPLFGLFAAIALVLSAVGLYGVTAYSVTQRTQEFGVRMALGARPRDVWWLVIRQGLLHLAIGTLLGMAGAITTGRLIQSWLFQTSPTDPATLAGISIVLMSVALTASFLPAYRSTRISPAVALRRE